MKKRLPKLLVALVVLIVSVYAGWISSADGAASCTRRALCHRENDLPFLSHSLTTNDGDFTLTYKFLDAFTLKTTKGKIISERVYLGGYPLGISVRAEGLIVVGVGSVVTPTGLETPLAGLDVRTGDVLTAVDGVKISTVAELEREIGGKSQIEADFLRKTESYKITVTPAVSALTGRKTLGLRVKEQVDGIGTLTFVNTDGGFGALGHMIYDVESGLNTELNSGNIYEAAIKGVEKGKKGVPGALIGTYNELTDKIGYVTSNTKFGVFGVLDVGKLDLETVEVASSNEVKPGKAYVYTTIGGDEPDLYEIQIIKSGADGNPKEKGLLISVTDRRLLETTGGIVQGMSGSPILQNGKLVGAVTHVFVNDPTKGYGIYVGWML